MNSEIHGQMNWQGTHSLFNSAEIIKHTVTKRRMHTRLGNEQ